MIGRLLVANRGEIARRVFRTCRDLGVETVAVFSDADADAPHVAEADHAVRLAGVRPADTYLSIEKIVDAARRTGADAVHPGYGFLSENAAFARAVLDAGLTWIGPPPEAVAAMGSKIEAKALMSGAGVPVLPGFTAGPGYSMDDLERDLDVVFTRMSGSASGWPVPLLVKASAGGGGRGMRVVRLTDDLPEAVESARREASSAFGDGTVFVEPLLEGARHIEVQILADLHGTVWALGERECSIQRRHQKVVEETPSPAISPETRAHLCDAAVRAAKAIGYVGAGTVEFLVKDDTIAFLEMNTRLQVEHPVTECVHGVDLVELQLRIAEGTRLAASPPRPSGHAVEVRLYAEDPALDWLPQSGTLHRFEIPGVTSRFAPLSHGLRLDSGVEDGSEIGVHYDPMLAKVISCGASRADAVRRLATALANARIHGPVTNRDLLVRVLRHEAFLSGDTHTGFLDEHDLTGPEHGPATAEHDPARPGAVPLSALAAALASAAANRAAATVQTGLPSGWRNVVSQPQRTAFAEAEVAYRLGRDGLRAEGLPRTSLVSATPSLVVLETSGVRHRFAVARYDGVTHVDSPLGSVRLTPLPRLPEPVEHLTPGSLLAPMPGTVLRVDVKPGEPVGAGQVVMVLEAMKMEHRITAPTSGTVSALNVTPGRQVEAGAVLAVIEERD
ncbi:acetyl/propionyl/methylcrotonyl-CoA carboxylase subunit alpha [Streptosporangium lutulentum]|uniref:Propionyl-CoA carboxylase alpha chain n=1 Tax=Streptosporangium lutulentum TaxID=1461250 RepID=A0ABT9Q5U8_9ACTN|nr:biotin carboxylase N-terminal domain-containing protein [Streptosporangium lutulentum]MDP9841504.1 propionyl-CoA carboxylase alpha chain [Streptosporangium lutulentum]